MDMSRLSDEELLRIVNGGQQNPAPSGGSLNVSEMSDEELLSIVQSADATSAGKDLNMYPFVPEWAEKAAVGMGRTGSKTWEGLKSLVGQGDRERAQEESEVYARHATPGMRGAEIATDIGLAMAPAGAVGALTRAGTKTAAALQGVGQGLFAGTQARGKGEDFFGGDAALATAGGALGELIAPVIARGGQYVKRLVSEQPNPNAGAAIVKDAGLDPSAFTPEQLVRVHREVVETVTDPERAALFAEFNVNAPRAARTNQSGDWSAYDTMLHQRGPAGDRVRGDALRVRGEVDAAVDNMRTGAVSRESSVQDAGSAIKQDVLDQYGAARRATDEAYTAARGMNARVPVSTLEEAPTQLRSRVEDAGVIPELEAPSVQSVLRQVQNMVERTNERGEAFVDFGNVEKIRQTINRKIRETSRAGDTNHAAAIELKQAFDGWLDDVVDRGLIQGDEGVIDAMKKARSLRVEQAKRFENPDIAKLVKMIDAEDADPEQVIRMLTNIRDVTKVGAGRTAAALVEALGGPQSPGVQALREHVLLMLTAERGYGSVGNALAEALGQRNIAKSGRSFMSALFSPDEINRLSRFKQMVDSLEIPKEFTNSSRTSYKIADMLQNEAERFGSALSPDQAMIAAMARVGKAGIKDWRQMRAANDLIRPLPLRPVPSDPMRAALAAPAAVGFSQ